MNDRGIGFDPTTIGGIAPVPPPLLDLDLDVVPGLPREHPSWTRDTLSVSTRAKSIIATIKPLAVRLLNFWDHHVRELRIGARQFSVDASGSYRLADVRN